MKFLVIYIIYFIYIISILIIFSLGQFIEFLNYTKSLLFDQEPNYDYLNSLIVNIMNQKNLKLDYCYDWKIINNSTVNSSNSKDLISNEHSETIKINDLDIYEENLYKDFKEIFNNQNYNKNLYANKIDNSDTEANDDYNNDNDENTEEYIPKNFIYLEDQLFLH
jgi:hypothetical protein